MCALTRAHFIAVVYHALLHAKSQFDSYAHRVTCRMLLLLRVRLTTGKHRLASQIRQTHIVYHCRVELIVARV